MNYLTEMEYYSSGWNEEVEEEYRCVIERRIKEGQSANWYKGLSPLDLYLHGSNIEVSPTLVGLGYTGFSSVVNKELDDEEILYMETKKAFYGNYHRDGVYYCRASLWKNTESNLDLWTITLYGTDDYSVSFDVVGEEEARAKWGSLFEQDYITEESVEGFYFSN